MMNLAKFLKGTITIGELELMPNRYIQTIYKEFVSASKDPKIAESMAAEEMVEAIGG